MSVSLADPEISDMKHSKKDATMADGRVHEQEAVRIWVPAGHTRV